MQPPQPHGGAADGSDDDDDDDGDERAGLSDERIQVVVDVTAETPPPPLPPAPSSPAARAAASTRRPEPDGPAKGRSDTAARARFGVTSPPASPVLPSASPPGSADASPRRAALQRELSVARRSRWRCCQPRCCLSPCSIRHAHCNERQRGCIGLTGTVQAREEAVFAARRGWRAAIKVLSSLNPQHRLTAHPTLTSVGVSIGE